MKQNVLFILVDQWPAHCFTHKGDNHIKTPNMDRLATKGTVFNNAFTSCPLCSPARGTLLSSKWQTQTEFLDNVGVGYSKQPPLDLSIDTWLDGAVSTGHHVGYFGKWHLGHKGTELRGIQKYDENLEDFLQPYEDGVSTYSYEKSNKGYIASAKELENAHQPFYGNSHEKTEETRPYAITGRANNFLDEYVKSNEEKPFMLTVSLPDPHFPHYLPKEFVENMEDFEIELPANIDDYYTNKPWFQSKAWWPSMDTSKLTHDDWKEVIKYAYMHRMLTDQAIGTVLDKLDDHNLTDNTTIIFTSDHGDMCGSHNRFDKGAYFYDEVWRIPLIIQDPKKKPAVQDSFVSILDIGKTLMDLTNYTPKTKVEGKDLSDLVGTNQTPKDWTQEVYGMYNMYNGMSFEIRAIRNEQYKYVYNPQSIDEFYNLSEDPAELHNLNNSKAMSKEQQELKTKLFTWMKSINDPIINADLPPAGTIDHLGIVGP